MNAVGQRLVRASGASGLALAARLLEQALFIPLLLWAWSAPLFGEWILISALPVYLALLDFGVVQSGSNELARRAGAGDEPGVVRFFREYSSAFAGWSVAIFLALALGMTALGMGSLAFGEWFGLEKIASDEAAAIFLILAAATLVSQNSLVLIAGLRARKLLPEGLMTRAIGACARLGAGFLAVLAFEAGPMTLAIIFLASRIGEYGWQLILLKRAGLSPCLLLRETRREKLRQYLPGGLEFMLFPLGQSLVLQGPLVLIGLSGGAGAVAIFAVHRTFSRIIAQIAQVASVPLRAEAGLLQTKDQQRALTRAVLSVARLTIWVCGLLALILLIVAEPVFSLWTGGEIGFSPTLLSLLVLASLAEALWSVIAAVRMGTNRHRPLAWSYVIMACLAVLAMLAVSGNDALLPVAAIVAVVDCVMALVSLRLTLGLLDMRAAAFLRALASPPAAELRAIARTVLRRAA